MKRMRTGWIFFSALMLFLLTAEITQPEWLALLPPMPDQQQVRDWVETILIQFRVIS
ncbi:MAG: hypothetical protein PUC06_07300 [Oscillospiraceae bacterium]|nr:hypothetical protein [Oscillospiraceae bacterium]